MAIPDLAKPARCIIIAGPNGAGKTTFAREFLPKETAIVHFVNADASRTRNWLALKRIAARVRQGGHDVARDDVLRRFGRSWANFERLYRSLADAWWVYDNSGITPKLLEHGP